MEKVKRQVVRACQRIGRKINRLLVRNRKHKDALINAPLHPTIIIRRQTMPSKCPSCFYGQYDYSIDLSDIIGHLIVRGCEFSPALHHASGLSAGMNSWYQLRSVPMSCNTHSIRSELSSI